MSIKTIPITESDYLVTVEGLVDSYWQTFSGIKDTTQTTPYSDGRSNRLSKHRGPRQVDDVTLTKSFNPEVDTAIVEWWRTWCSASGEELTITVQPVQYCPNPLPKGPPFTLMGCKPTSLSVASADKTSSNISMIEMSFSVDDYTNT